MCRCQLTRNSSVAPVGLAAINRTRESTTASERVISFDASLVLAIEWPLLGEKTNNAGQRRFFYDSDGAWCPSEDDTHGDS